MKIVFLGNTNSIHCQRWIKYFVAKGDEIHWISLFSENKDVFKNPRIEIYPLKDFKLKSLNIFLNIIAVKRLIKKISPDVLSVHYAGVNGALGALSNFHPFLLTVYGSDILIAPKSILVKPLIKYILKKANLITCDANHIKKAIIELGAEESKIKIIYFGVDTKKFSSGKKEKSLIKQLDLFNSPAVISLRMLEPIYNIETFIRAAQVVLKEIPNVKFIIAGKGSEENYLKNLSESLGISKNIRFIGLIPNDNLPKYLRVSNIYVSTSLSDAGISSSTAEAMACGLPVIVTDFGDNREWVKNKESGFLIPPRDFEALAEKIIYFIKNKEIGRKMGEAGRKIIKRKNDYYKEMKKARDLYKSLCL